VGEFLQSVPTIRIFKVNDADVAKERALRLYKSSPDAWDLQVRGPMGVGFNGLKDGKDFVVAVAGLRSRLHAHETVLAKYPDACLGPLYDGGPDVYKCSARDVACTGIEVRPGPYGCLVVYAYAEVTLDGAGRFTRVYAVPNARSLNTYNLAVDGDCGALAMLRTEYPEAYVALVRVASGAGRREST
jgi:hypothetical protein